MYCTKSVLLAITISIHLTATTAKVVISRETLAGKDDVSLLFYGFVLEPSGEPASSAGSGHGLVADGRVGQF